MLKNCQLFLGLLSIGRIFLSDPLLNLLKSFAIHFHFSLIFCPVISIASQEMLVWNIKLFPYFLTVWPPLFLTRGSGDCVFHLFHPKQNNSGGQEPRLQPTVYGAEPPQIALMGKYLLQMPMFGGRVNNFND